MRGLCCIVCRTTPGVAIPGQSWPLPGPEVLGGRSLLEQKGDGRHMGLYTPNTTLPRAESGNDSGMGGGTPGANLDLSVQLKIYPRRGTACLPGLCTLSTHSTGKQKIKGTCIKDFEMATTEVAHRALMSYLGHVLITWS